MGGVCFMMKLFGSDDKVVILHCECGASLHRSPKLFKEITNEYVIPNDDFEVVCFECGVKHTNSVIVKETEPVKSQPVCNIPKCPTCGSPQIERISTLTKATSFGFFGVFSRDFNKTFHCKKCNYRW